MALKRTEKSELVTAWAAWGNILNLGASWSAGNLRRSRCEVWFSADSVLWLNLISCHVASNGELVALFECFIAQVDAVHILAELDMSAFPLLLWQLDGNSEFADFASCWSNSSEKFVESFLNGIVFFNNLGNFLLFGVVSDHLEAALGAHSFQGEALSVFHSQAGLFGWVLRVGSLWGLAEIENGADVFGLWSVQIDWGSGGAGGVLGSKHIWL